MRLPLLAFMGSFLVLACGKTPATGNTESGTDTSTGTDTDTSTTGTSTPTTSGAQVCAPGLSIPCTCQGGDKGAQVCRADGSGYDGCECEGGGSQSASDSSPTDPSTTSGVGTTTPETTSGPGTTTDVGTTTEGTIGTTEGSTTGPDTTTGEPVCDDPGPEPNESEDDAVELGEHGCGDMAEMVAGVLDGSGDVDWYTYHGTWGQLCLFGPNTTATVTASDDVRLCVFADCDQGGDPNINCKGDGMETMSPDGLPGCCGSGDVAYDLDCGLINKSARMYLRVDQAPDDACVEFSVAYDFDT